MATRNYTETVVFKAAPHDVYEALMDSRKHAAFTGAAATISRRVGGKFTAWDGYLTGTNLELEKDKKIVQDWRASDWPEGAASTVTFLFEPSPEGTKLTFTHKNIPAEFYDDIVQGWRDYYWEPIKTMLEDAS
jgi:activator of HSP90 ATPase